ncbi:MAG: octaprenyl diphosphate synthase [Candidatus Muproteobacteria bacterium RBG_16_65_31]|uniref:Octaprenyl diphosphate synthase n=1 Tax=Candidatus Muproteobacteria bacterium RBG_16_65_31 TaxID=1817759 RepID=A0A1F6THN0_9PROT|nr:MAG: octaprenyl diphosphate synthase [Candidatus Muproteobacteria bacterium RBG_16_65_31]
MDFEAIKALAREDMQAVNREIQARLKSDVALINQLSGHIINSGGKRLRPMIVLLASRAFGYRGEAHIKLAAIVEFIHTATLLHDDVVDASEMRRGQSTANTIWGNEASVLVGDFLYSRAFEMMVEADSMRVMEILAHTTNTIARGEVMQLLNCHDPETTEERYLDVIRGKTAKLFEAAAQLGAVINGQNGAVESAMAAYGLHLGTAFQLTDDALDYSRRNDALGKNIGADLAEGKPTLPLIHALRAGDARQQRLIRQAIEDGGLERIDAVLDVIESAGSIAYTARRAEEESGLARQALSALSDSPYKQALFTLAHFSVHRNH